MNAQPFPHPEVLAALKDAPWRDAAVAAFEAVAVGYNDHELDQLASILEKLAAADPIVRREHVHVLDGVIRMAALHWLDDTRESDSRATTDHDVIAAVEADLASDGCMFRCPVCGCSDIIGRSFEADTGSAWQRVSCGECDATWTDGYTLDRVLYLTHGGEEIADHIDKPAKSTDAQRIGQWVIDNAGEVDAEALLAALGGSSVAEAVAQVADAVRDGAR